jgi:glycosyltransferase involved in cell wall biosynthesis
MKKLPKKKVLCFFDYNCATGFGNVSHQFVEHWKKNAKHIEFVVLAINYYGEAYRDGNFYIIPCNANQSPDKMDGYGRSMIFKFLGSGDFDLFFAMQDLQVMQPTYRIIADFKKELSKRKRPFKAIHYFPVDSDIRKGWVEGIEAIDGVLTYTNYGANHFKKFSNKKIDILSHGADLDNFKPVTATEKAKLREKHFNGFEDKKIIMSVNRNQGRKDIGATLLGFQKFLNKQVDKSNYLLYMHMNPKDKSGNNLLDICKDLEITDYVAFPSNFSENKGEKIEELAEKYQCADVFVSTTKGEGWGLTITEAMACGIPVIAPNHTSIKEITNNGSLMFPLNDFREYIGLQDNDRVRQIVNPDEVAEKIEYVLNADIKEVAKVTKKGLAKMQTLSWLSVCERLQNLLEEML